MGTFYCLIGWLMQIDTEAQAGTNGNRGFVEMRFKT